MPYGPAMIYRAIPVLLALALPVFAVAAPTKPTAKTSSAKAAAKTPAPVVEAPLTVDSLLAQAKDAITKGDSELAVRLAQAAIVQDPARTGSYVALGDVYASSGQPDYARSYYDAALDIDPADAAAQKALSDLNRDHPETTARNSK
jgi:Flp pilus assembly protein TadD